MLMLTGAVTLSVVAPAVGAADNATTASAAAAKRVLRMSPPLEHGWPSFPACATALAAKLFPRERRSEPRPRRIDRPENRRICQVGRPSPTLGNSSAILAPTSWSAEAG